MPKSSSTTVTVPQARALLGIVDDTSRRPPPPPSRDLIQKSFLRAAKMHHPDTVHNPNARPCSVTFRRCLEARSVLLNHYHGMAGRCGAARRGNDDGHPASSYRRHDRTNNSKRKFGQGFPFQTLRVLSLRQNLALRGTVMVLLTIGTAYDEWGRYARRRGEGVAAASC